MYCNVMWTAVRNNFLTFVYTSREHRIHMLLDMPLQYLMLTPYRFYHSNFLLTNKTSILTFKPFTLLRFATVESELVI